MKVHCPHCHTNFRNKEINDTIICIGCGQVVPKENIFQDDELENDHQKDNDIKETSLYTWNIISFFCNGCMYYMLRSNMLDGKGISFLVLCDLYGLGCYNNGGIIAKIFCIINILVSIVLIVAFWFT
jgi:hypothetical protein